MTQEYPKALYRGSKAIYDTQIADDLDHEIELRKADYVDFIDLPDPVIESRDAGSNLASGSKTHDGLVEKLVWTEEQLATSQGEFIAFKNDIGAMKARIAELQGDTTPVGATSDNPNPEPTQKSTGDEQGVDFSLWTADQLRDELTKRGIEFKVRDSKADLIALLGG